MFEHLLPHNKSREKRAENQLNGKNTRQMTFSAHFDQLRDYYSIQFHEKTMNLINQLQQDQKLSQSDIIFIGNHGSLEIKQLLEQIVEKYPELQTAIDIIGKRFAISI